MELRTEETVPLQGTIITMSASPYSGILDPIYLRLENKNGLLRRTCDASMLMEALLDVGKSPCPNTAAYST